MKTRVHVLGTRSKLTALLVGIVLVVVLATLLAIGFTVLVTLAAIGTLAGLVAVARRAIGTSAGRAPDEEPDRLVMDPAKQVFPAPPAARIQDR